MSFSDRNVSLRYAGSQMSDSTRVCAYMYKTVEHLSIHNADEDESSEDYGAADVQVNILHHIDHSLQAHSRLKPFPASKAECSRNTEFISQSQSS